MRRVLRKAFINALNLFTAFSFFRLRSADLVFYQYVYPSFLSIAVISGYEFLGGGYFVVKLDSFVASATTLMGVLVGFYIAALAAVTSFPNESLNNIMSGDAPKIREKHGSELISLTRRRFLSILLGYCAFQSIFIFVLGSISAAVDLGGEVPASMVAIIKATWWFIYAWLLSSLFIVTMLCLHYLIERMHRD
jgi:hypothetical protein